MIIILCSNVNEHGWVQSFVGYIMTCCLIPLYLPILRWTHNKLGGIILKQGGCYLWQLFQQRWPCVLINHRTSFPAIYSLCVLLTKLLFIPYSEPEYLSKKVWQINVMSI